MIEALKCPTCGGPVRLRGQETLTLCLYCNGALKITRAAAAAPSVEVDASVPAETVDRIKELILQGDRAGATALYQQTARCDAAAADAAIETYVRAAVNASIFSSTLNAFGVFLYVVGLALIAGGLVVMARELAPKLVGVLMIALGVVNTLVLTKPALKTLRYIGATRGEATILRRALIGRNGDVSTFLLLLSVRDPSGATFVTEAPFPARQSAADKVQVGRRFHVKYLPNDPKSVTFAGLIEP